MRKGRAPRYSVLSRSSSFWAFRWEYAYRQRAGRFRNFAGGIPRAMRQQLFKALSISGEGLLELFNAMIYKWKYLKSIYTDPIRERDGSTAELQRNSSCWSAVQSLRQFTSMVLSPVVFSDKI